jgi:hypothetical protein
VQVGAAGKGIEANLLQSLGNVDGLKRVDVLEGMVLYFLDIIRKNDADRVLAGRTDGDLVFGNLYAVSDFNTIPEKFHTIISNC